MTDYDVAKFNRFDIWITRTDGSRELHKSIYENKVEQLEKYIKSRRFKKLLSNIIRVEVLQIFDKVPEVKEVNQTMTTK